MPWEPSHPLQSPQGTRCSPGLAWKGELGGVPRPPQHPQGPQVLLEARCTAASCSEGHCRKSWKGALQCRASCPRRTTEHGKSSAGLTAPGSPRGGRAPKPRSTSPSSPPGARFPLGQQPGVVGKKHRNTMGSWAGCPSSSSRAEMGAKEGKSHGGVISGDAPLRAPTP